MTVAAPIVSQACIRRTRLLCLSILRILSANDNVTLMGRPSGTETTMSVTASITVSIKYWASATSPSLPETKNSKSRPKTNKPAMT